jgi:hypothetical protein
MLKNSVKNISISEMGRRSAKRRKYKSRWLVYYIKSCSFVESKFPQKGRKYSDG